MLVSNLGPIACLAYNQQLCVIQQHTTLAERVNGIQFDEWKPKLPLMMVFQVSSSCPREIDIPILIRIMSHSNVDSWPSQVLSRLCMLAMILNARIG